MRWGNVKSTISFIALLSGVIYASTACWADESSKKKKKICYRATSNQIQEIIKGNQKKDKFLSKCKAAGIDDQWCDQLIRPNPDSEDKFRKTYGNNLPHQLINPNESTWKYAFQGALIVQDLVKNLKQTGVLA